MAFDLDSRAAEVAEALGVMTPPIRHVSLRVWAMRRGWDVPSLDAALDRAAQLGLVVKTPAGLMAGQADAPMPSPVEDQEVEPEVEPEVEVAPAAPEPATLIDCLCARTAPQVNYGCLEHGGARITTNKEHSNMAKDWISREEAMGLLDCGGSNLLLLAKQNKIERRGEGTRGKPSEYSRTSVIAYRDGRARARAATDLLPATPARRAAKVAKKSTAIVTASAPAPAPMEVVTGTVLESMPSVLTEVRVLVRWVDKGWFTVKDAWSKLRELVAT